MDSTHFVPQLEVWDVELGGKEGVIMVDWDGCKLRFLDLSVTSCRGRPLEYQSTSLLTV